MKKIRPKLRPQQKKAKSHGQKTTKPFSKEQIETYGFIALTSAISAMMTPNECAEVCAIEETEPRSPEQRRRLQEIIDQYQEKVTPADIEREFLRLVAA